MRRSMLVVGFAATFTCVSMPWRRSSDEKADPEEEAISQADHPQGYPDFPGRNARGGVLPIALLDT
jgi:hypothetical protein